MVKLITRLGTLLIGWGGDNRMEVAEPESAGNIEESSLFSPHLTVMWTK